MKTVAEEKRSVGRPLKFKSAKELQRKIEEYFESCEEEVWNRVFKDGKPTGQWEPQLDRNGQPVKVLKRPLTITGLALHLGTDRKTLLNYEEKEEFFPTIKEAKTRIENYTEEVLVTTKNATGVIFNLKNNYGWSDKTEVESVNHNMNTNTNALTPEERRARIDELNRRRGNGASNST